MLLCTTEAFSLNITEPITPNHSQAGQCHLKNRGRYQRVPRRLKNYYSKNQTTKVAYRRKNSQFTLIQPHRWFSSAFIVPIISHSHNPYPKTMTLFFLNNWLIYKGRHGLLKCTTIKKKNLILLCDYTTTFRFEAERGSLLFLKTADIK